MAFGKNKYKFRRRFIIFILIVGLIGVIGLSINYYFINKINLYKDEIEMININLKRKVLMSKSKAIAGAVISNDNFYESEISSSLPQEEFVTTADYGKVLLINIKQDLPIMQSMVEKEIINKDIREEELNMLLLPSNLIKNHYVDIRIGFPNGEDYIVLSKKKVQEAELSENTIWLWLDEKEILTLSSAIVDAYIHKGSKLYTVRYVAPSIQDQAIFTYPVNQDVLKIIKENPNIIEEAKKNLSNEARNELEKRIGQVSEEALVKINEGISVEVGNRENKILKDIEIGSQEELHLNEIQEIKEKGEENGIEEFY